MTPTGQGRLLVAVIVAAMLGLAAWSYFTNPPFPTFESLTLKATAQPNFSNQQSGRCRELNNVLNAAVPGSDDPLTSHIVVERNPALAGVDGKNLCGYRIQFQYDGVWYEFPEPVDVVTGTSVSTVTIRLDEQGHVFARLPQDKMEVAARRANKR